MTQKHVIPQAALKHPFLLRAAKVMVLSWMCRKPGHTMETAIKKKKNDINFVVVVFA